MADMPEKDTQAERDGLEQRVRDLAAENERLQRENAELRSERDAALEKAGLLITEEDVRNAIPAHPWLDEIIARLESADDK
jgi:hypothetical protein